MSRQRDRDEFIALLTSEGVPVDAARALLRAGAALHRIAELACSSEAADRDRVPCPGEQPHAKDCGQRYAREAECPCLVGTCLCRDYGSFRGDTDEHGTVSRYMIREARTKARVRALCQRHELTPIFNGDPRGAVLKLRVPSGRTNDGGREGVYVP